MGKNYKISAQSKFDTKVINISDVKNENKNRHYNCDSQHGPKTKQALLDNFQLFTKIYSEVKRKYKISAQYL